MVMKNKDATMLNLNAAVDRLSEATDNKISIVEQKDNYVFNTEWTPNNFARVCKSNVIMTRITHKRVNKKKLKSRNKLKPQINLMTQMEGNIVKVNIQGFVVKGLIDIGASVSCVSGLLFDKLDKSEINLKMSKVNDVYGVGGERIKVRVK